MGKIVGIDLGGTNSLVAVIEGDKPLVIPVAAGGRLLPSMVSFTTTGERLVGQMARSHAVLNSENTVFSINRFMGRRYREIVEDRQRTPYQLVEGPEGDTRIFISRTGQTYTPQEISAMIISTLKKDAETYLGDVVEKAVITVPAYFDYYQCQATKDAGMIAGLDVLQIINQPTACLLAYGLEKKKDGIILVFNLGGSTCEISVLEVNEGMVKVMATTHDTHLGGSNWNTLLTDYLIGEFNKTHGIDLSEDRPALQRILEATERAKIELSSRLATEINLPFITANASGPLHLSIRITRTLFEKLSLPLVQRCRELLAAAFFYARCTPQKLDELMIVGGATRMPMIQQLVHELTIKKEPIRAFNPDEVAALGAAIQSGIISGTFKPVSLQDMKPLPDCNETPKGDVATLIPPKAITPTSKSEVINNETDAKNTVIILHFQGEHPIAAENLALGTFKLDGLPPMPPGVPHIEVTIDLDAQEILDVTAVDQVTGSKQKIGITGDSSLDKADIERMVQDAQSNAFEDNRRRETLLACSEVSRAIHQIEKPLHDPDGRMLAADRARIEAQIAVLKILMKVLFKIMDIYAAVTGYRSIGHPGDHNDMTPPLPPPSGGDQYSPAVGCG